MAQRRAHRHDLCHGGTWVGTLFDDSAALVDQRIFLKAGVEGRIIQCLSGVGGTHSYKLGNVSLDVRTLPDRDDSNGDE
jgi:hypothetical protein